MTHAVAPARCPAGELSWVNEACNYLVWVPQWSLTVGLILAVLRVSLYVYPPFFVPIVVSFSIRPKYEYSQRTMENKLPWLTLLPAVSRWEKKKSNEGD